MHLIQVAGLSVHIFENCRGLYQWEPLGTGEPWYGSEEYGSAEEAERSARCWGEDRAGG
jgi:hypothetical protein